MKYPFQGIVCGALNLFCGEAFPVAHGIRNTVDKYAPVSGLCFYKFLSVVIKEYKEISADFQLISNKRT